MTIEDAKKVIKELRKQGLSDDQIQYSFSMLYFNDKIDFDGYEGLINLLGYHFNDEFKSLSKQEQYKCFLKCIKKGRK